MRRGRWTVVPILLAVTVLLLAGLFWAAVRSMALPGSAREAQRQAESLSETLHLFLEEHRETLEALASAAQAGDALPDSAVQALLDSPLEGAELSGVSAQDGALRLTLDNSLHTGKLYTYVTMGSGAPPLPEGVEAEAGQSFWTLHEGNGFYHFAERLEENWYAEYECVTRG